MVHLIHINCCTFSQFHFLLQYQYNVQSQGHAKEIKTAKHRDNNIMVFFRCINSNWEAYAFANSSYKLSVLLALIQMRSPLKIIILETLHLLFFKRQCNIKNLSILWDSIFEQYIAYSEIKVVTALEMNSLWLSAPLNSTRC